MKKIILVLAMVAMLLMFTGCANAVTIPEGYVGIAVVRGAAQEETLSSGKHWTNPFTTEVVLMDTRWQKYVMTSTYYDGKNMLTKIQNDAKGGYAVAGLKFGLTQTEVDDAVIDAKALLNGPVKEGGEAINEMYDTIDEINLNQSLSSKQKNDLIREARKECMEVLSDVNAELWAYQEKYCTGEGLIGHFVKNTKAYSLSK